MIEKGKCSVCGRRCEHCDPFPPADPWDDKIKELKKLELKPPYSG